MTPEGKVKASIRMVLDALSEMYYEMYVPTGYGKSGLDFTCCWRGRAIYIEAKKNSDANLRPRQRDAALKMLASGAAVFVIGSDVGVEALRRYFLRHGATFK